MIEVDLQDQAGLAAPTLDEFQQWIAAALAGRRDAAEVTIRLVSEAESQALNLRYRGKDQPTNVLSFEADLPPDLDLPFIGDVLICPAVLAREAAAQGKTGAAHWAHLTVHGVLHLLGYDHQDEAEAASMETLEVQILTGLGYPDPYQLAGSPDRTDAQADDRE
jgi:probable rRNA maturation factor